jgi:hypothetical protein
MATVYINIQLVRIGLVRSVDRAWGKNGPHRACTYYILCDSIRLWTVLVMCKESEHCQSINVCINNDAKEINPVFLLCRLKMNNMMRCELWVYSWTGCNGEQFIFNSSTSSIARADKRNEDEQVKRRWAKGQTGSLVEVVPIYWA